MPVRLSFTDARDLLLKKAEAVGTERVPLSQCGGRVLARDLAAVTDVPAFDCSPYDGYAFRAEDSAGASGETPVTLRVLGELPAGSAPTAAVTKGTAVRLMTGAPIPPGADAVCKYEDTVFTPETVTLYQPFKQGDNIVRTGEDVQKGEILACAGEGIDAGIAGALAAQGIAFPLVYREAAIGIISTGDEVREATAALDSGKIYNSNRHMLEAVLKSAGLKPVYLGLAGDSKEEIRGLINQGLTVCDAIVATGGVSVGDYDFMPEAMESAGAEILFRGVDLKPGMACAYGIRDGKLICGLSGSPASSLTNFYAVALPALKKIAGWRSAVPQEITVTLKTGFPKKSPKTRLLRGRLELSDGTVKMALSRDQGNMVLSSAIGCNVMAVVPAGSGPLAAGTTLKGFLL